MGVAARLAPWAAQHRPAAGGAGGLLAARAASTSGGAEGQVSADLMERMRSKIAGALDAAAVVEVADVQGDGRHVEIVVVSKEFEGKSAVNRQRMVYKASGLGGGRGRGAGGERPRALAARCRPHPPPASPPTQPAPSSCPAHQQAIWEELQDAVHAVDAMVTRTPEEAGM